MPGSGKNSQGKGLCWVLVVELALGYHNLRCEPESSRCRPRGGTGSEGLCV